MKILVLNNSSSKGGAAHAANRITEAISKYFADLDIKIYVDKTQKLNNYHADINNSWVQKKIAFLRTAIDYAPRKILTNIRYGRYSFWFIGKRLSKFIEAYKPDIIHLHWINEGFLSCNFFEYINKNNIPVVITMHDSWYFTGGCHSPFECRKYENLCFSCPQVKFDKYLKFALRQQNKKKILFQEKNNYYFIAPSTWLYNNAKLSKVLANNSLDVIPNPIDTEIFKNYDKNESKKLLKLNPKKKYILFGSSSYDELKGYKIFQQVVKELNIKDVEIITFGADINIECVIPHQHIGYLRDTASLNLLYSAADFVIVPSLQENLSYTIMESLSSGTPVIAFDVGGNSDLIKDNINGFLIKNISPEALREKIIYALSVKNYQQLSENARKFVEENFSYEIIAKKYLNLYNRLMDKK